MRLVFPILIAAVSGCAEGETCRANDPAEVAVIRKLTFARATEGVSDGFDLDGVSTVDGQAEGCGIPDWTAPDGSGGIDNAFARMIPALELTEAAAVEGLIQNAINSGELLLLIAVHGLDDPADDSCVDVEVMRGDGDALVGGDGLLLTGQTLGIDAERERAFIEGGVAVDGSVEARPFEYNLPITIFDFPIQFHVNAGAIRVDLADDQKWTGVFGGGIDRAELISVAQTEGVDSALVGVLDTLLSQNADLSPGPAGVCEQVSINFEFEAVPAYVFP
jgi:hypothetical protein